MFFQGVKVTAGFHPAGGRGQKQTPVNQPWDINPERIVQANPGLRGKSASMVIRED